MGHLRSVLVTRFIHIGAYSDFPNSFSRNCLKRGCGGRSERGIGRYTETKMPFRRPVRLQSQTHLGLFRQFL